MAEERSCWPCRTAEITRHTRSIGDLLAWCVLHHRPPSARRVATSGSSIAVGSSSKPSTTAGHGLKRQPNQRKSGRSRRKHHNSCQEQSKSHHQENTYHPSAPIPIELFGHALSSSVVCLEPSITPTVRPSTYRRDNTSAGRQKHWHAAVPRRFIPNVQGPPSDADPPANASRTPVKPTLWFEFTLTRFAARCLRGGRPSFRYRPTLQNHAASGPGPTSRGFP